MPYGLQHTIDNEQLDLLPMLQFEGNIVLIDKPEMVSSAIQYLMNHPILGFDTETKPNFRKGEMNNVCLLQLATNDIAFIFRLNKIGMPNELLSLLSSTKVKKIGVAIHDDLRQLARNRKFIPEGFLDLQTIGANFGVQEKGLKKMTAIVLGGRISKSQRTSNWELEELSQQQLLYAATDAWVCLRIYDQLTKLEKTHGQKTANHIEIR